MEVTFESDLHGRAYLYSDVNLHWWTWYLVQEASWWTRYLSWTRRNYCVNVMIILGLTETSCNGRLITAGPVVRMHNLVTSTHNLGGKIGRWTRHLKYIYVQSVCKDINPSSFWLALPSLSVPVDVKAKQSIHNTKSRTY